jgi:hypothetical protein
MTAICTTLERIDSYGCLSDEGWEKLLAHLGKTQPDAQPLPYAIIVKSNGLEDALFCCRAEPQYERQWRLFSVRCVRRVKHLISNPLSSHALDVTESYAKSLASEKELADAWADALGVVGTINGASVGAAAEWTAAVAAVETSARFVKPSSVAQAAALAESEAAELSFIAKLGSGDSAYDDARAIAKAAIRSSARRAARAAQTKKFLRIVGNGG